MKKAIILLTGCINPNGMPFTKLTDANERQRQYIEALHYYLNHTSCPIVFCENSLTDLSTLFNDIKDRLEILTFKGNQDKQRGKGFGEAEILEFAFRHSLFIHDDCIVVKITGRLIVSNIASILNSLNYDKDFVTCQFHSNLLFADSRIFCATPSFYMAFLKFKDHINDSKNIYFEHILASTVLESPIQYIPFTEEPFITGMSGSTGELYTKTTTNDILYQSFYWRQLKKVYNSSRHRHLSICKRLILEFNIFKFKVLSQIK